MKAFNMAKPLALALLVSVFSLPGISRAGDWSSWQYLRSGVSVSFCRVKDHYEAGNSYWTWRFRNESPEIIKSIEFDYTEFPFGLPPRTLSDVCPVRLHPGEAWGGWATFSAVSWMEPSISIREIHLK